MTPEISIITVSFNAERTIRNTIQSVKNQSFTNIEYLVIDGKSSDNTVQIIKEYESQISRWISEPDKGIYDAMNKGLEMATGKYVLFLNADDRFFDGDVLSNIFSQSDGEDIFYGETKVVNQEGKILGDRWHKPPKNLNVQSFRYGMCVSHQSFIVKRKIAPSYNLKYSPTSDYDWVINCVRKATTIKNTGIYISKFMEGGVSSQNKFNALSQRFKIMVVHYGFFGALYNHFLIVLNLIYYIFTKKEIY